MWPRRKSSWPKQATRTASRPSSGRLITTASPRSSARWCSSSCCRSASRPRSPCSRPGSGWSKSRAGRTRRLPRCGCITPAGRHPPARPTGRIRPLLGSDSWPPKLFNTAYYKSQKLDSDLKAALATTDKTEKAKFYKDAQETVYQDTPWVPLVTEELLSAKSKKLSGVYTMPDGSFNFIDIDLH